MKIFFPLLTLAACLIGTSSVFASASNCLSICTVSISGNSGHTSTYCNGDSTAGCLCDTAGTGYCNNTTVAAGYPCPSGYHSYDVTATNRTCCVGGNFCLDKKQQEETSQTIQSTSDNSGLESVFGSRSAAYFGIVDYTSRSPSLGRTVSIDARLDACMGYSAVDNIVASSSDQYSQWQTCTGSNYCGNTLTNGYCSANGNQVCLDRCNCKYQAYLATIGVTVTCSNL